MTKLSRHIQIICKRALMIKGTVQPEAEKHQPTPSAANTRYDRKSIRFPGSITNWVIIKVWSTYKLLPLNTYADFQTTQEQTPMTIISTSEGPL